MRFSATLASGFLAAATTLALVGGTPALAKPKTQNEIVVAKAVHELFIKRNASILEKLWSDDYKQHNPGIADGRDHLAALVKSLPADFKYEPGFITSQGDIVMVHGRYVGFGPKPMVAVDIFRLKAGKLVEHWDVMQEEVPAAQTKSGRPMFDPAEK